MTRQPIPEGLGQPDDIYDDGTPELSPQPIQFGPTDTTSFEHGDVAINTILFSEDGHPQGRLVSIVVHTFGEIRATRDYRAAELTRELLLDNLQQGINAVIQEFLFQLAETKKKQLEVLEKVRSSAPSTPVKAVSPVVPLVSPVAPAAPPTPTRAPQKVATKAATITQFEMF